MPVKGYSPVQSFVLIKKKKKKDCIKREDLTNNSSIISCSLSKPYTECYLVLLFAKKKPLLRKRRVYNYFHWFPVLYGILG